MSVVFAQVIKYCEYHKNDPPSEDPNSNEVEIVAFDVELMKEVDQGMLFEMILVRIFYYLSCPVRSHLLSRRVALFHKVTAL